MGIVDMLLAYVTLTDHLTRKQEKCNFGDFDTRLSFPVLANRAKNGIDTHMKSILLEIK